MVSKKKMGLKLLEMVDLLHKEKNIDKELIFSSLEEGLARAYEKANDDLINIKVEIDRETGEKRYYQIKEIVDKVYDDDTEISLKTVKKYDPDAQVGDEVELEIKNVKDDSRISAQICKQIFSQKLKAEECNILYEKYKNKKGEIMSGVILRKTKNTYYISIDNSKIDVVLGPREQIRNEKYNIGDKITFYIVDVKKDLNNTAKIIASRTHPEFVRKLLEREITEVFDKTIEIVNIARDPGSRCKISVLSHDMNVDPVGTCV
ncbi:MAG TPA: transcription termination/antitermination protein NusA, partial [bacterium]|nr:transcription termination/antitermination protein NusA [bacterium]